ncbi:hypothetical protein [Thioclava sp. DLFJ5-1]|uniref:hypothetical protein n=1 Tax=Thioclava sp. DLFJ5-1 TaxID=1915314 RepID=UPI001FF02C09|nr:hypothetical protein [Thioclava sp. DLFJ5-1]
MTHRQILGECANEGDALLVVCLDGQSDDEALADASFAPFCAEFSLPCRFAVSRL